MTPHDLSGVSRERLRRNIARKLEELLEGDSELARFFSLLTERHRTWALVGGAPRSWALEDEREPTDLDVVVSGDSGSLEETINRWLPTAGSGSITRTRLGGFRLTVSSFPVDIWLVRQTVSIEAGRITDSKAFRAVAKSAALTVDSCVYTSRGTLYEAGFLDTLRSGLLRLNYWNPSQERNIALKAVRLCKSFGLSPDLNVQMMVERSLGAEYLRHLLETGEAEGRRR